MLKTFEPNVAQKSVASQNDHKSKACLPEASSIYYVYRLLKKPEAPVRGAFFFGASQLYFRIASLGQRVKNGTSFWNTALKVTHDIGGSY